jgi:protein O-mannosyl-transferase
MKIVNFDLRQLQQFNYRVYMAKTAPVSKENKIVKKGWFYFVFVFVAFLFYGNTLNNGFSMDDELVTVTPRNSHPTVSQGVSGIAEIFTSHYAIDNKQSYSYRPITTASFAIEYELFKDANNRAFISHFISILLYGLCAIILFNFLDLTWRGKRQDFALFVTVLFMIHPIHSEVVNNIKSRDELLLFLFGFAAGIQFLRSIDTGKLTHIIWGVILFILANLSKESGIVFLALIPLTIFFFRPEKRRELVINVIVLSVTFLTTRLASVSLLGEVDEVRHFLFFENPLFEMDFMARIPVFFYCLLFYIIMMCFPYPLKYYYGFDEVPMLTYSDGLFYVALIVVMSLVILAFVQIFKRTTLSYAVLFFFLAIGGAANLIFPVPGIVAERFATLASVGFVIALSLGLLRLFKLNPDTFKHSPTS